MSSLLLRFRCPWCGGKLRWLALVGGERPMVTCVNATCQWQGRRGEAKAA